MTPFATKMLPLAPDVTAPDGSDVRILLSVPQGSMAHFQLAPGQTTLAVEHRTVDELWFILSGSGEMWRQQGDRDEVTPLTAGVCVTIPLGTRFQFRAGGDTPLQAVAVTLPPWPGEAEANLVAGVWCPTVAGTK